MPALIKIIKKTKVLKFFLQKIYIKKFLIFYLSEYTALVATMDFDSSKRGVSPYSAGEGYQLGCSSCAAPVEFYSIFDKSSNLK